MMAILVDTGPLYAAVDRSDAWHSRIAKSLVEESETLVVPAIVLPEVCYLLLTRIGERAEVGLLRSLDRGELRVELQVREDLARALEILEAYSGQRFGLVDAMVMATAERLGVRKVMTLDRRHFSVYRPRHCSAFEIIP